MNRVFLPLAFIFSIPLVSLEAQPPVALTAGKSANPDYPRVNLAPHYEVDPSWPERPPNMPWRDVPGISVDKHDNVWIFTRTNPAVQVFGADGKFVRALGEGVVSNAHHIKIDYDGNVWLADIGWHIVRKCTPEGKILLTIGTLGRKGEGPNLLNKPTDMAIARNGDVFISDGYGNSRLAHFNRQGKFIKAWGTLGTGQENFSIPHAITLDSHGRLYVADRNNVRVQVYNQDGHLLGSWRDLIVPWGFWMTDKDELWVCGSSPMPWRVDPKYPSAPLGLSAQRPVVHEIRLRWQTAATLDRAQGRGRQRKPRRLQLAALHGARFKREHLRW